MATRPPGLVPAASSFLPAIGNSVGWIRSNPVGLTEIPGRPSRCADLIGRRRQIVFTSPRCSNRTGGGLRSFQEHQGAWPAFCRSVARVVRKYRLPGCGWEGRILGEIFISHASTDAGMAVRVAD